jgi:hypothetical protein
MNADKIHALRVSLTLIKMKKDMTKNKINLLSCFFFFLCAGKIYSQSNTVPTGGEASGSGGTVSYTIGTVTYITLGDGSIDLTEGLQQPYEITIINGIKETGIVLSSVYPNPTTDHVTLSINSDVKNMSYSLFDAAGKIISSELLDRPQTDIAMTKLAAGTFYIKVYGNRQEIKTYQVIKNN